MAADHDQHTRSSDDASTIALLRCLRAGATVDFVHCIDVLSAAPSDLVASLEPAPGIDGVWYFYCLRQYKNAQGKACGHRKRAISGGDTCWHAEGRPKEVDGSEPGTACNLSYGRMDGRSFSRLGWCMTEYDDDQDQTGYVLCKVYRSPRAQVKVKPPSSSAGSKRKAAGVEHPEAPPANKLPHEEYALAPSTVAQANGEEWIGGCQPEMFRGEEEQHVQKLSTEEPTQAAAEFFETPYGPLPSEVAQVDVMEWIGGMEEMSGGEEGHGLLEQQTQTGEQDNGLLAYPAAEGLFGQQTTTSGMPPPAANPLPDGDFFDGMESFFGVREEQSVQMQQPRAEPADPLAEFVQSQWIAFQQQESPWMTMQRLLQGPPTFLKCS
ncbi:unnamed protein product [Urochloa decumbens]|uniref:NAC domain-containing protein n=1 Tax=Urochloa decumbens TaxID=240449 RepID=A0ABC8YNC8_9POAL